MFIVMNRLRVTKGCEASFEQAPRQATSFVEFHLLKGPEAEDHTLYASCPNKTH
jgi:heme-degrading monooxygenase HmoA